MKGIEMLSIKYIGHFLEIVTDKHSEITLYNVSVSDRYKILLANDRETKYLEDILGISLEEYWTDYYMVVPYGI